MFLKRVNAFVFNTGRFGVSGRTFAAVDAGGANGRLVTMSVLATGIFIA
jgi:hypothetical protein